VADAHATAAADDLHATLEPGFRTGRIVLGGNRLIEYALVADPAGRMGVDADRPRPSLSQNIDTTTPEGRMFLKMLMVLAEYEREIIVSRTYDGLARARKQGKKLGRPKGSKDRRPRPKSGYHLRWARNGKEELVRTAEIPVT